MAQRKKASPSSEKTKPEEAITRVILQGFKSLVNETSIEIRPLTVLAGANSSGKTSAVQPLLLLKQTLEATFDPGTLLLSGPNVSFNRPEQMFSKGSKQFRVRIDLGSRSLSNLFRRDERKKLVNAQMTVCDDDGCLPISPDMGEAEIRRLTNPLMKEFERRRPELAHSLSPILLDKTLEVEDLLDIFCQTLVGRRILPVRCFLSIVNKHGSPVASISTHAFEAALRNLIHVPALRTKAERAYPRSGIGEHFPGTFDRYVASLVRHWQDNGSQSLKKLEKHLERLQITWKIEAHPIDDVQVELRVARLQKPKTRRTADMVSIADVGFGVSQVLPVLVALIAAEPGQMVYIEQPEIHLHPRAQAKLAEVLVKAANRGVRVVAETHSENLLLGIQTCVAEGLIDPAKVKLHWFSRGADGVAKVNSADLDEAGAFGDWPEDFAEVSLSNQKRYLDAAEKRLGISAK